MTPSEIEPATCQISQYRNRLSHHKQQQLHCLDFAEILLSEYMTQGEAELAQ
jgi:hypothetical protein